MRAARRWAAALIIGSGGISSVAAADEPDPRETPVTARPRPRPREIVIEIPGERSRTNVIALGGVAGSAVLAGAIGLVFHLDSRSATEDVEEGVFSGKVWTQEQEELAARAERSAARATVLYGIGGALVVGLAIAYIVTEPKTETSVIRTTRATPAIAPVAGGAVLGGAWRF